ncbi:hypothetical protein J1N09_07715 [Aureitalea sp. L0-47]|uniref:hypothetical protein n=1 Tax=Aureitalea sp. L0-47 TaxID=2816962 RepID=UPI0022386733|nr:hypothetical protein [Aureitalea sp. L0-47]MCW5519721.1 hypothetical protein [Aureitalea sp. L0-47]
MGVGSNMGSQKFNILQRRNRRQQKKLADIEVRTMPSGYEEFEDHTNMKGHEFADFQKRLYAENTRERRRFRRIFWSVMALVLVVIVYFLFFYEVGPIKSFKWP